jgi:hypothetical protein
LPIEPAQLASSLGALGSVNVERGLAVTVPQVLRSAERLQAAAARGRIIDAEAERRRADQAP